MEQLKTRQKMIELNPPLHFAFKEEETTRNWIFAEIGKIHTITEKDEKTKISSESL